MQNTQSYQLQRSSMKERFDQFSNQSSLIKKTVRDPQKMHQNRPSVESLMSPNPYSAQNDDFNDAQQISNLSAKQSNKIPSGKQSEHRQDRQQHSPSDLRSNGGNANDDIQNSKQIDPNEFSGIMSSPGLCGNNSLLGGQDDVMNDFMQNLKRKMNGGQDDDLGKMNLDEMQASNLDSKMLPPQSNINSVKGSQTQVNKAIQPNILQQSGVDPGLKQSQFSEGDNQKKFEEMSQLGQFAQLSCLYNNLSQQPAAQQNQALENFKNDKSLLKHLEQNNLNPQNLNAEQFLSQLSQFGFDAKKAADNQDNFNLEELEFSDKTNNMLKQSSIFKASSNMTSNHQKPPTSGGEMSFQNELELKSLQQKSDMILQKSSLGTKKNDKYSQIMKKLTDSLQNNEKQKPMKDEELNLAEMAQSLGKDQENDDRAAVSQLKQSQLFSNKKDPKDKDRFNRWLNENDAKEDRLRSYDPESGQKDKNSESKHDVKNQLKSLSTNSLHQKFQNLQKSRPSSQKSQEDIQKEEDIKFYQNNMRLSLHSLGSGGSGYKTQPKKEKSPKDQINDFINEPSSEKNEGEIFSSMQGLIVEKERLNQEQQKIRENKFLKMVDRSNAIKSVRSLSRTIDELLSKEKEKISEHYQSKMSQLSKSKASEFKESRILGNLSSEKNENEEQLKESFLKVSNLTKTKGKNMQTPGGTTDSLQFSQSIALSNLAATIKTGSKGQTQGKNQTNPRSKRNDQKGEIQFDDLRDNTDPRSQFLFSGISNLKDQIHEDNYNDQIDDSDLERQKSNKESYPPRMSQKKFEEELMASITKRGQNQIDSDEIEFQANRMSQQNSLRDFEPQSQNFIHKEGALQFPEQVYSQTQNKDIEILQLRKEKDAMQLINEQLESKLALKDKQMQIYLRQIEIKAQSQEQLQNQSNQQLQQLEKELEELHQDEIKQLKKQHLSEIHQLSRQMEGGSQDPIVAMQLEQLSQENHQLKQEINYHKEVSDRYQILQRSFDQIEMAKLDTNKAESKFDEDSKLEEKVEERLRPLIDEFQSKNKALKQERDEMAHQIQKVKQSTILEIQNSRHDSELQIQQMNLQLEKQQMEHERKRKEIAKLQGLLEASKTDRSEKNFDELQRQMQAQLKENTQLYQKVDKLKSQSSQKDTLIKQLQESIQQLETGLSQISHEAQAVVKKNIQYKQDNEQLKKQIQQLQIQLKESSNSQRPVGEQTLLMQSQHIKNQQMIGQLQDTIGAQKELIKQLEQQNQEQSKKVIDQTLENQEMSLKIKEQQSLIQNSKETQNSLQLAEKAQVNLSTLEKDQYLKSIDQLKLLESKSKKKATQMQGQINEQLKEISQVNQKYAKQLEVTNEMKQQLEDQLGDLTSTKLEASELKLSLQKKTQDYNQLKQKLEGKFLQQDKVIAHKQRQIDDLKESISLKITCADDIQSLLKQQKIELQDTKTSQRQQEEKSNQQIEEIRQKMNSEREQMLQKLWSSQNEVKQLSIVNREMLDEIDSVKSTLKVTNHSRSPSSKKNPRNNAKGQKRNRSKSKSSQMEPMLSHLDQMKSTYQSKVSQITGNQQFNNYMEEQQKPKDFSFDDQNKNQINLLSTRKDQESEKNHEYRSNTFSSQTDKSELKVQQLYGNNALSNQKDLETINSKNENRFIRVDEKHDSNMYLGARRPSFGSSSSSENQNKSSHLHSRNQESLPQAVHSGQKSQEDDSFETFRDKAHFGNLQGSQDSFQTKQQTSEKQQKMRMNTESMEDIFRQFKDEQDKIIHEGLKSNFNEDLNDDQELDQKPTSQKNSEQLPVDDLDNIDVFDQWVQSISQK